MYRDGLSCSEISAKVGMSDTHVCRILKEYGEKTDQYRIKKGGISMTDNGYLRFNQTKSNGVNAGRRLHDIIAEMKIGKMLTNTFNECAKKIKNESHMLTVVETKEYDIL